MPSDEKSRWISSAGFVVKDAKEEKLRLVCDLRELNKSTTSGYSIFPTPNEVMQSLKATSRYYIKSDLIQGYHQLEIAPESKNYFCFALETGLYRYLRAPMGFSGSSHFLTRSSRNTLKMFQIQKLKWMTPLLKALIPMMP